MFLLRNKKNYQLIILNTPSYLELWPARHNLNKAMTEIRQVLNGGCLNFLLSAISSSFPVSHLGDGLI